jgi:hypothetical protein
MYKSSKNDALAAAEEPRLFFQRIDLSYWAPPVLWMAAIFFDGSLLRVEYGRDLLPVFPSVPSVIDARPVPAMEFFDSETRAFYRICDFGDGPFSRVSIRVLSAMALEVGRFNPRRRSDLCLAR